MIHEGFDGNKEAMLSYNPEGLAIELNMSNNVAYLDNILSYEAIIHVPWSIFRFMTCDKSGCLDPMTFEAFTAADEEVIWPEGLAIELNMSNNVAYLDNILSYEANEPFIYGCHNFYPQEGSALPYD
jgi:hypothetical protein